MTTKVNYADRILWLLVYPVIACSFIFIANDNSFYQLIKIPSFTTDILFALGTTYFVGWYVRWLSLRLERVISIENFHGRIKLQILYGVIFPLCVSMTLEILYLYLINITISESSILYLELPLSILFLTLINIFHLSTYLYHLQKKQKITEDSPNFESIEYFTVQKGYREEKVDVQNCAFIKSSNKVLWLYTFDDNHFRLNGTLEFWEARLESIFFKINRQYIVASAAIKSIEQTGIRKLKVNLCLPQEEEIFISKSNATDFKKWWRGSPS